MAESTPLTLYYAPRTRSFTALWLLEELGVPYALESFDLNGGRNQEPDYLALNPMGKVPLVVHGERPVSELGAIAIYLADRFPGAGLAPGLDDDARPAWLRWLFFASAIMEPAYGERFFGWDVPARSVAWGSFDRMLRVVTEGVTPGPFLLGEAFSAADVHVGATLRFGLLFGILPKEGPLADYVARCTARPAFQRAESIEARESERFPLPAES